METVQPMRTKNITVTVVIFLISASVVHFGSRRAATLEGDIQVSALPDTIGQWVKQEDIEYEERVKRILGTTDVTGSIYRNPDNRMITVSMVKSVNNRSAFHPPEQCLIGSGSQLMDRSIREIPFGDENLQLNEMVISYRDGSSMLVWNWYGSGDYLTANFYRQQFDLFIRQLRHGRAPGSVVILYIDMGRNEEEYARRLGEDFMSSFLPVFKSEHL